VKLEEKQVPEKPRETVKDNDIKRFLGAGRVGNEPLKLRPFVIRGRSARLNVFRRDCPAFALAIGFGLAALVRDGKVLLGLPCGRDTEIKGCAHYHDFLPNPTVIVAS
jgi:hypothetical protein